MMDGTQVAHTAADTYSVWLSMSGILGLILLIFVVVIWFLRRVGVTTGRLRGNSLFRVKYSLSLGPRERLVVVEIDDQWLLLGVTAENITCLKTMEKKTSDETRNEKTAASSISDHFQTVLLNSITQRRSGGRK
ncbi:MAG: flagellar biosynthetic protein FliO [Enterobacteriaceae bacterium]|jgi:flagellar protein FliO/FliZ|nr:flagellar biosynthetic protein FliO [Enterobacteriaceae bacterium]